MRRSLFCLALASFLSAGLGAGELPPELQAKFVKILANNAGSVGKVACKNATLAAKLGEIGMAVDPGAKVAWASSEAEVGALKGAGKMVICGALEWLPKGGAIAVVEEGGKPQIYLHMGNIAASGVTLSDAVLKIGKRL